MKAENELGRIRWKCRRGMLELDILLQRFVDQRVENLSAEQKQLFEKLLEESDPVLYGWLLGHEAVTKPEFLPLVQLIQAS